ncbi:MAG TPA: S9 family peptidase [Phycisphaerae bacterium]
MTNVASGLPPLIAREILFGNPERASPALSPDGTRLAWLAADAKDVMQVWVQTIGQRDERIVTADKKRGIRDYAWAMNNRTLLYFQDSDGDENYHMFGVDLANGTVRDCTPFQGINAYLMEANPDFPDTLLVGMNVRDRSLFDVYRLNLHNGALDLDTQNPGDVAGWVSDSKLQVRAAEITTPDGGTEIRLRKNAGAEWKSFLKVGPEEILEMVGFSADGESVYLRSSVGRDTAAVVAKNIATGEEEVVASHAEVDAGEVLIHPIKRTVQAVAFAPARTVWRVTDPGIESDFAELAKAQQGDFWVISRTHADDAWVVIYMSDRQPQCFYQWDRKTKAARFLFSARPKLDHLSLAEMSPVTITTRDGLAMHAYLTLPVDVAPEKLPMVLYPHGGPWARDGWGFHRSAQWLANRGYAVLQPNFRGSTGYGKAFLNAGNKQWGKKMHDDLIDAVNWAVEKGLADPLRVGIYGGSYGGYCALAGVTFTPTVFACAVDVVGPSDLRTLVETIPPYWKPIRSLFDVRMANIDDPKDAALIDEVSPLKAAHRIVRPLMIAQGANDPRVKQSESEQMVAAIEKNGGSVTYVLYTDEGHGFARPENSMDFSARAEAFLAAHLGGRFEPMAGEKVAGSMPVVRVVGK